MSAPAVEAPIPSGWNLRNFLIVVAFSLVGLGVIGQSHAAIGYALFLIATLLLLTGTFLIAIFGLTKWFNTNFLWRGLSAAFWMGGWCYVLAVSALSGYYVFEAFMGRMPLRYILFGPAILFAIIVLDVGIWRGIIKRNLPTMRRFGDLWKRENLDAKALGKTIIDDVILHRSLYDTSIFRWVRHQLIFWGFGLMFLVEMLAVMFREAFPAFGWIDLWHLPAHPLKLTFDLAYDLTGLMVLVGCILALVFRVIVRGKEAQKYADTPTSLFLLVVAFTGFMVEGSRLGSEPLEHSWASFVGLVFVPISPTSASAIEILWIFHALAACAFIAYVPVKRMIHSCATPLGRIASSQTALMAAKKTRSIQGLFGRFGGTLK